MANILSRQYEAMFSKTGDEHCIKDVNKFFLDTNGNSDYLNDIEFSLEDVEKVLLALPNDSAAGPDGVPSELLKNAAKGLREPLWLLYRQSLDSGQPLESVYSAAISPIFKGGNKSEAQKYRPVSLTSHIVKVFERLLRKSLVNHLEENKLINESQHGFRSNRSTLTQLLEFYETVVELSETGSLVDAVYLDYAKAFDKVSHNILMKNLKEKAKVSGRLDGGYMIF